ncbi:MAG: TIGR02281 family clan AA aspartic protease [Roseobacter sp.]
MENLDTGRLIYLAVLGAMLIGWFFTQGRISWNKSLQHVAVWALIFGGAIAMFGLWNDISRTVLPQQTVFENENRIVVPRRGNGHYYIQAEVNGTPIEFVLDTGASSLVLTQSDAKAAGFDLDGLSYFSRAMTANGEVRTAPVKLDRITLGPVTDINIPAVVNEGDMNNSLMGMNYLQRWGKIEISGDTLTLIR